MKTRILICLLLLAGAALPARAIPVMPGITQVLNGDGKYLNVRVVGDDFFHYTLTEDGYLVSMAVEGPNAGYYVYAYTDGAGNILLTDERVGSGPAAATKNGISRRQKGMPPHAVEQAMLRREARIAGSRPERAFSPKGEANGAYAPLAEEPSERRGVVLLIEFPDLKFTYPREAFDNLLNQKGYAENGAMGSAADYFYDNSMGKAVFRFDVYGPVCVSKPYSYYGGNVNGNDAHADELVVEAAHIAARDFGVDFSLYDQDGVGRIDMIFYFFAGHNEAQGAPEDRIWPHKWEVRPENIGNGLSVQVGGETIGTYACTSELQGSKGTEMAGIGVFCHEFSHVLGLADTYDVDYEANGLTVGMGKYSLMSQGNFNLKSTAPPYYMAFERVTVGWMDFESVRLEDRDEYRKVSLGNLRDNDAFVIPTRTPYLFYYVEARQASGWDSGIPGSGVLVYLVDRSDKTVPGTRYTASQSWQYNCPNAVLGHLCADIVKANGDSSKGPAGRQSGWPYPYNDNNSLTPSSSPNSVSRYNESDYFFLENIVCEEDGTASFTYGEPKFDLEGEYPLTAIKVPAGGFTAGSPLELIDRKEEVDRVVWYVNGKEAQTLEKGENVEIAAMVFLKNGTVELLYKYADVK